MSLETVDGCAFRFVKDPETPDHIRVYVEQSPQLEQLVRRPNAFGLITTAAHVPPFLDFSRSGKPRTLEDARNRAHAWARRLTPQAEGPVSQDGPARPPVLDALRLSAALAEQVKGQDDALEAISDEVIRHLAKTAPRRPLSMLLTGPTGVGKTQAIQTLAKVLSTQLEHTLPTIRINMSEFRESYRVSQLLGSPPGYVGYGDTAPLARLLLRHRRCLIHFDEIEKAHPDLFIVLMNAMDCGQLALPAPVDDQTELDCRSALFCFTSNLGAESLHQELSRLEALGDPAATDNVCREHLRKGGMPAELIGRVTRFIPFAPLEASTRTEIIYLVICNVAKEYNLLIAFIAPKVLSFLLAACTAQGFGVRTDAYTIDRILGPIFVAALPDLPDNRVALDFQDGAIRLYNPTEPLKGVWK